MYNSYAKAEEVLNKLGFTLKEKFQSNTALNAVILEHKDGSQAIVYSKTVFDITQYDILLISVNNVEIHSSSVPFLNADIPTFASVAQKAIQSGYKEGYKKGEEEHNDKIYNVIAKRLDGLKEVNVKGVLELIKNQK